MQKYDILNVKKKDILKALINIMINNKNQNILKS